MLFLIDVLLFILLIAYIAAWQYLRGGLKTRISKPNQDTSVSIIVSMHNEEDNVADCLQSLLAQNYPKELSEIIIVNDRSQDQTAGILNDYQQRYPEQIKVYHHSEVPDHFSPKKYAIDTAVRSARGDIILLTDADGRPGPNWAQSMVHQFTPETGFVIGYAPYTLSGNYNYGLLALEYFSHAAVAAASTGRGFPATCVGTNLAYRRQVFLQLDGFGQFSGYHSGDDDLFLQRVRDESGYGVCYAYDSDSFVYNAPPATFRQFFNQRLRYASKGFFYPWKFTATLTALWLFNFVMFFYPLTFFADSGKIFLFITAVTAKLISDYIFMTRAAGIFSMQKLMRYFMLAEILHVPYVFFFGLAGQFISYEWGSRNK